MELDGRSETEDGLGESRPTRLLLLVAGLFRRQNVGILGQTDADVDQFKAILAAEIIKVLNRESLSVRGALARTGIAATDFSRIRHAGLRRFTVDWLMSIINRLGSRVDVKVKVRRAAPVAERVPT